MRRGRFAFMRSLQFRLMVIFVVVGMILTAIMSVMSYNRMVRSAQQFVDEELSQISSVAINYNMIIPRRWEAPASYAYASAMARLCSSTPPCPPLRGGQAWDRDAAWAGAIRRKRA